MRVSANNGGTWETTGYQYVSDHIDLNSFSTSPFSSGTYGYTISHCVVLLLRDPSNLNFPNSRKLIRAVGSYTDSFISGNAGETWASGNNTNTMMTARYAGTSYNGIRFYGDSNIISGNVSLYGIL